LTLNHVDESKEVICHLQLHYHGLINSVLNGNEADQKAQKTQIKALLLKFLSIYGVDIQANAIEKGLNILPNIGKKIVLKSFFFN
jgi:dethiobiotin synthetase